MLRFESVSVLVQACPILRAVTATVPHAKLTMLVGPNGAGKTTLLKAACGLRKLDTGCVTFTDDGAEVAALSPKERAARLAWVPSAEEQPFDYRVIDVVTLGRFATHRGMPAPSDAERANRALQTLGIQHFAQRKFNSLSSGERQKVQVARALASDAPLLVLDEPCANLDVRAALELLQLLSNQTRAGRTVLLSVHDIDLARRYADHVICLKLGRTIAEGSVNTVLTAQRILEAFGVEATVAKTPDGRSALHLDLPR